MPRGWFRRSATLSALIAVFLFGSLASAQQVQPGYSVLRVANNDGDAIPYVIWIDWIPTIVATPDGGSWAFFSAQPAGTEGAGDRGFLYAARYNPETDVWEPARRMPGGEIVFGASAAVDGEGRVHVVYSSRAGVENADFSTLVYTVSDGNGGWAEPTPVAANESAGHQLSPDLALDGSGILHVLWQDQRNMTPEQRGGTEENLGNAAFADIFSSSLVDGAWTNPVQVSARPNPDDNASRPQVVVDGDRQVAVWSVYQGASPESLQTAIRVEWSERPVADPAAAWSEPQTLLEQNEAQIGGRLVDLAPAPGGGAVVMFGRRSDTNAISLSRLPAGESEWSDEVVVSDGEKGSYPTMAVGVDGTVYLVYENGAGAQVDVGGLAVAPEATTPGPDTIVSPSEVGAQGRPNLTVGADGAVWVIYFHQPENSAAIEVRVLRGAQIPSEATAEPEAEEEEAAEPEAEEEAEG